MTDQERARALLDRWFADDDAGDMAARIAAELAAVRADERRAIVAWLRKHGAGGNAIERGEHAREEAGR